MTAPPDISLEQQVAMLPAAEREEILSGLDIGDLAWDWSWQGRPSQLLPTEENWTTALAMAGRGWGKSRAGSEWLRDLDARWSTLGRDSGHLRGALLGRTAADVRDTMLEGPSGLLNVYPPSQRDMVRWIPSRRRVELPGGAVLLCFSAEEPDQLRGPQFHVSWADEIAAYKQKVGAGELTAWDNLRIAVRLGSLPQIFATTTPKRVPLMRKLLTEIAANPESMLLRRGRTDDNLYLSAAYKQVLLGLYAGTTLGQQELDGEMLDDVLGAMTTESVIDAHRVNHMPDTSSGKWIRIVGVDPSVAEKPSDECGIIVVYAPATMPVLARHAYVVEDASFRGSPAAWADRVVSVARKHNAIVVAENNQGGALVKQAIRQAAAAQDVPPPEVKEVWSSKAKAVRAEPIGAAYEKGRVHHLNVLPDYEDQATSWTPTDSGYSPDRMDAAVHALGAVLFPGAGVTGSFGSASIVSVADRRISVPRGAAALTRSGSLVTAGRRIETRVR